VLKFIVEPLRSSPPADRAWYVLRLAFVIGATGAAIVVVGTTIQTTILRMSPVVNGDQWEWVELLHSWLENGFSWSSLFAVQNDHRTALFRIALFADYLADRSTNRLLFTLSLVEYIATVAAFAALRRWAARDRSDWIDGAAYVAFVSIVFFSAANLYNLTFANQTGFIFGHVGIVFAVLTAALGIEAFKRGNRCRGMCWHTGAAIIAFGATFAQSNSILIWPLVLTMSWIGGVPTRYLAAFAAVSVATIIFFFSGLHLNIGMGNTDPRQTWTILHTYSEYMPQYLGNIIVDALRFNFQSYALGWIGLIGTGIASVSLLRDRSRWTTPQLALFAIMVFVVITAWLAALTRQGWGGSLAMVTDRYRLSVGTFWAAALALMWSVPWRPSIDRAVRLAVGVLMTLIILAVVLNQRPTLQTYLAEGRRWDLAANALRMGISDKEVLSAITLFKPPWFPPPAPASVEFLRARQLSVFADGRYRWIGQPLSEVLRLAPDAHCSGSVDRADPLKDNNEAWHMAGQAWNDDGATPSQLVIVDEAGMVAGLASANPTPRDLRILLGRRAENPSRWEGLTRGARNTTQTIYGIRRDGTSVCKVTSVQLPG
jgi:hypothetical protein